MRTVIKTYCYKLYSNKKNKYLDEAVNIAASIWNYCIAIHRRYYKLYGKSLSAYRLMNHITKLKKKARYAFWNKLGSQAIQDVVQRVDRSYKAFFEHVKKRQNGRKSPPGFKKRSRYLSFTFKQAGYSFHGDGNIVTIMGRNYKYCKSRPCDGTIKTVTVKRNRQGEFFLYVVTKQECNEVYKRAGKAVGMDFGLKHFLTLDDGKKIGSPEWYKSSLKELRAAHRAVSRCKKESCNRRRAVLHLDRVYEHIAARRRDWFFKLAHQLVGDYSVICIEDLNVKVMQHIWGRKISDVAFVEFISVLEWVSSNTGSTVVKIDKWAPSSQDCNVCGYQNRYLTLADREWDCPRCGAHHDRDTNAAINIKKLGLAMIA